MSLRLPGVGAPASLDRRGVQTTCSNMSCHKATPQVGSEQPSPSCRLKRQEWQRPVESLAGHASQGPVSAIVGIFHGAGCSFLTRTFFMATPRAFPSRRGSRPLCRPGGSRCELARPVRMCRNGLNMVLQRTAFLEQRPCSAVCAQAACCLRALTQTRLQMTLRPRRQGAHIRA